VYFVIRFNQTMLRAEKLSGVFVRFSCAASAYARLISECSSGQRARILPQGAPQPPKGVHEQLARTLNARQRLHMPLPQHLRPLATVSRWTEACGFRHGHVTPTNDPSLNIGCVNVRRLHAGFFLDNFTCSPPRRRGFPRMVTHKGVR
jgi:hypothetical protein